MPGLDTDVEAMVSGFRNAFKLAAYAKTIGTGENNKFVYTCKYGWIDHGHLMNNALIAYYSGTVYSLSSGHSQYQYGRLTAWAGSLLNEIGQQAADSDSAWTAEDLVSNKLGRDMAVSMGHHDLPLIVGALNGGGVVGKGRLYDIPAHWNNLLKEAGAIRWVSPDVDGRSVREWLEEDILDYMDLNEPDRRRYSVQHALHEYRQTRTWKCLCAGDKPLRPEHRYEGFNPLDMFQREWGNVTPRAGVE